MSTERLEVIRRGQAPTIIFEIRGELTSDDGKIKKAYKQATIQEMRNVIVDFSQVDLMNSAGISQLFYLFGEARKVGQRVLFSGLTPHYRKILTIMGLTSYAQVHDTLADAQKALQTGA